MNYTFETEINTPRVSVYVCFQKSIQTEREFPLCSRLQERSHLSQDLVVM